MCSQETDSTSASQALDETFKDIEIDNAPAPIHETPAADDCYTTAILLLLHALARAQDGNLFWEISFIDTPESPEPERWMRTLCNFLKFLAWESIVLNPKRLFPTARLLIVRDLFIREWQARSREKRGRLTGDARERLACRVWPSLFKRANTAMF